MKKRRLFLLLLLAPAACAVFLSLGDWVMVLLYLGAAALGFGLEALALHLSRNGRAWLRFVPLALLAVPLALAWRTANSAVFLAGVAAVFLLTIGLCGLCGWGAAWALAPDKREKEEKHHET